MRYTLASIGLIRSEEHQTMQYERGQSGNPAGRPVGINDKRLAMRELLEPHAEELVAKVVEMAKTGDTAALRICMAAQNPDALPSSRSTRPTCARP